MSQPLQALSELPGAAWLVGGAIRDRLLGRATADFDVAAGGDPRQLARALASATDSHVFKLSEGFGAWRVVARDHRWQVDLLPLAGETIEADLGQRDLTINAIAQPLAGGSYVDPFGGLEDLRARRLRTVSPQAFANDPLRTLRLARLSCELEFALDPDTAARAAADARSLACVAPERIFAELRGIVIADRALDGLALMDSLGLTQSVLPELAELRGVEQSRFHHLDVYDHTRAVLAQTIELERDPEPAFGRHAGGVRAVLAEPLANELTRGQALRFAALLHDIAKPQTRSVNAEGRVTFIGHDRVGAQMARAALHRLRASERLAEHVSALTRNHLRLGFLVHQLPLTRRTIYGYLSACTPVEVDVTVLSVADRLATRGAGAEEAIAKHVRLARELIDDALEWRASPPRPPIRGDKLARSLALPPGPALGQLLEELTEASFAGEIRTEDEAIEQARQTLARLNGR
ncbi:MAG: HDIG domain-containing protein [Solirubrobacterales bacterium]|nr:HDIG domain-containing protein [Solirubrobacterales bacterium]